MRPGRRLRHNPTLNRQLRELRLQAAALRRRGGPAAARLPDGQRARVAARLEAAAAELRTAAALLRGTPAAEEARGAERLSAPPAAPPGGLPAPGAGDHPPLTAELAVLRARAEHYRMIAELTTNTIFGIRVDRGHTTLEWVVGDFEHLTGYTPAMLGDQDWWRTWIYPEDHERSTATLHQLLAGQTIESELRIVTRAREVRWVRAYALPVWNEQHTQVTGCVGAIRDVTEFKRAGEALRESEARLRAIWNTTSDGVAVISAEGIILEVNPAGCQMIGYRLDELVGRHVALCLPAELQPWARDEFVVTMRSVQRSSRYEVEIRRSDGSNISVEAQIDYIVQDGPRPLLVAAVRDITERRRVAEQLKASLAEKEILLREIHHRVKNNLQVITSLLDLQLDQIDDPRVIAALHDSHNRIRAMAMVHEKLYQSSDLGQIDFARYLEMLVGYVVRTYASQAAHVQLDMRLDEALLVIDTAIPCGLIVNELLSNALKYAFPAGRAGVIQVRFRALPGARYELVIGDNGVGLPDQLDMQRGGSLGLQLVQLFVSQLHGHMTLDQRDGTTYIISFAERKYHYGGDPDPDC